VSRESGPSVAALVPCHVRPPDPALLDELAGYVSRILVVGDGVPLEVFSAVAGTRDICVLALPRHVGKGSAVAAGLDLLLLDEPIPDAVVVVDADGQHPPAAIPRFVAAAEAGAELVIGDRFGDPAPMPPHRRIANRLTSRLVAAVAGRPVRDTQCGMRLLTGRALHDVPFPRGAYEAETRHLRRCLAAGVAVSWVPIPAIYKGEPSSFRAVRDGIRVLRAAVGP
jgi:glycosyltransferase involved in cell wall biosynthesis